MNGIGILGIIVVALFILMTLGGVIFEMLGVIIVLLFEVLGIFFSAVFAVFGGLFTLLFVLLDEFIEGSISLTSEVRRKWRGAEPQWQHACWALLLLAIIVVLAYIFRHQPLG